VKHQKPDAEKVLSGLKDFQRRTVDYVFRRLYTDTDHVNRFLVADEVGLGKTLVARGLIAKAVDHLWEDVPRIDVIYICSNQDIARQNVNRLAISEELRGKDIPSRMTLLPLHVQRLQESKLNFVSFSPGTSFDLKSSSGWEPERVLLYHILREAYEFGNIAAPKNLFQCGVTKDNWRRSLKNFDPAEIEKSLKTKFIKALKKNRQIKARFDELCKKFGHHKKRVNIKWELRQERNQFIGELRKLLAECCVEALEPDIVILDEFQRFKYLIDEDNELAHLAQALFNFRDKDGNEAKVLLLSATPYKMYTMSHEEDEDHYRDFISTLKFLFTSDQELEEFEKELLKFKLELLRPKSSLDGLMSAKEKIEGKLKRVMVRTERLSASADRDGMLSESGSAQGVLDPNDLKGFTFIDQVTGKLEAGDALEYWKSAPYILNLMDRTGYQVKRRLLKYIEEKNDDPDFAALMKRNGDHLLYRKTIESYSKVDPANAKLRTLIENTIGKGAWKLLWVPPALPYYQATSGPYSGEELSGYTKSLIFSSWRMVPKVIAALCSYEAERKMVSAFDQGASYSEERKTRSRLIQFRRSAGRLNGMFNFTLVYPAITLATAIDPLALSLKMTTDGDPPTDRRVITAVKDKIRELIEPVIKKRQRQERKGDQRWYWATLPLLDREYSDHPLTQWLQEENGPYALLGEYLEEESRKSDAFEEHIDEFQKAYEGQLDLGAPPDDLVEVLTKVALGSPAVTALRSLLRLQPDFHDPPGEDSIWYFFDSAYIAAEGFRTLFNMPDSITLIRGMASRRKDEQSYWENVLDYCVAGNLQAVLDEYFHVLREFLGLIDSSPWEAARGIAEEVQNALSIRTATLDFDEFNVEGGEVQVKRGSLRARFALRFGEKMDEEKGAARKDVVRSAFNSPFRPFILTTTSIGQEGLDFHLYCHEIYHWNLPANPVDLEQREGRIHRYKGHAIRKNIARAYSLAALQDKDHPDPWHVLFLMARADNMDKNELVPYWIFNCEGGTCIIRHVPTLPLSRDIEKLDDLHRSLAVYRMVFGQPRQEDLLHFLRSKIRGNDELQELTIHRIDLSPE